MIIHLIDGTFELYRHYFAVPSHKSPGGEEVGAVRGVLRYLAGLLSRGEITHVGFSFDRVVESFRNDLYDGYKTGTGIEPELWSQFPLAEEAARALGIVLWPNVEVEADDAIATMALRAAQDRRVKQVVMRSPDKDLAQMVSESRIVMYNSIQKKMTNEEGVRKKFGIGPESIPDFLALVGDAADGIPGIPRWGAKSTATVLSHYKHVKDIPDSETDWEVKVRGAKGLAANLREQRADAELFVQLTTLRTDVPLEESVDDLEWKGANRERLEAFARKIGDNSIMDRVNRWQ